MRKHAQLLMAVLIAAACLLPTAGQAQLYVTDGFTVLSYQDTVATVVTYVDFPAYSMALDHQGRLLMGSAWASIGDTYYVNVYDPGTQVMEGLYPTSTVYGYYAVGIAPDEGDDIYVLMDYGGDKGSEGSQGSRITQPFLAVLLDGEDPAYIAYLYPFSVYLIDLKVRPTGANAGNILALVKNSSGSEAYFIEVERTGSTTFQFYQNIADGGLMPSSPRAFAFNPEGTIIFVDNTDGLFYVDEEYGTVHGFGSASGPGLSAIEIDSNGTIYLANSSSDRIQRFGSDGSPMGPPFGHDLGNVGYLAIAGFTPTPEGEDVLVEPGENIEITFEEVTESGFMTAIVETSASRTSPEGNYLPSYAVLPGSRADVFTYISLGTDAVYSGVIQVDVLLEGSRLFYASGVGDTFRDFTVVGSIEDARGTIPRFSELPMPGGKRDETGPTEVVLVEDTRALPDVTDYKFWRLESAMAVPDTVTPCPWGAIHSLRSYVTSARSFRDVGNYGGALFRLSGMNSELRDYAGSCIPESSADSLGNLVGSILAHSKTLMHSLYLEAREKSDWGDAPDPTYPTLASSNGASHMIDPFVCLGYILDADPDGQPDSLALGDDNDGNDDDDGIAFPARMFLGKTAEIVVTSWWGGQLSMWLDGNGDGDWNDWGEFLVQGEPVNAGLDTLFVPISAGFAAGETYARFRLGSETVSSPTGVAPDGEVEDYLVTLEPDTCVTWTPDTPAAGETMTVYYDLDCRGVLAPGTSPVYIHIGHSGWQDIISPDPAMAWDAGEGAWRYTYDVPGPAASVEFVFNDGAGAWDNNSGVDWSVPVAGGNTAAIYEMDGALDAEASLVGSGAQLDLYVDFDGTWLYVATQGVGATSGLDHFILVDENPSGSQGAPWAKAGTVAGWDYLLGNEGDNNWSGWFNSGEVLMTCASVIDASVAYLEGALDLDTLYGSVPDSILIAVGGYGTADGAALIDQAPAGNGNGDIERAEYYVLDLSQTGVPEEPDAVSGSPRVDVFPNPVIGRASIQLSLPTGGNVSLSVYDVRGHLVTKLVSEALPDGVHHVRWDGLDGQGRALPSGIYFLRLDACGEHFERKVVLLR